MLLAFFVEALAVIEQFGHTLIHDAVVDVTAVPTGFENAHIGQTAKLVGYRRWFHADGLCQIAHAGIVHAAEGVQKPKPGRAGQHLEKPLQTYGVSLRQ